MLTTFILSALAVVPSLGAPTLTPITKRAGPVKPDSYIIKFKDGAPKDTLLNALTKGFTQPGSSATYNYDSVFNGVAAKIMPLDLAIVQGLPDVEYIERDGIVSISYEQGIDGFSSVGERNEIPSTIRERHGGNYNGAGVTIYSIDTGIYTAHSCFGKRAKWGKTFGGYPDADGNGHGTHTAATAVGNGYGLATGAEIIAVKVVSDTGSGSTSDMIAGVNYACEESRKRGNPTIVTMSVGDINTPSFNEAVRNCILNYGVHFTVASGNANMPADTISPANVEEANTIGAVDTSKNNQRADFSDYGKFIDVWAPGVNITSAWIGNPTAKNTMSGTSMATPYVAGILAVALGKYGSVTPAVLSDQLKSRAAKTVTFKFQDPARYSSNNLFARPW